MIPTFYAKYKYITNWIAVDQHTRASTNFLPGESVAAQGNHFEIYI